MDRTHRLVRLAAASAAALVLTLAAASPALARPEPAPVAPPAGPCALERIGTQFVRCDDLTGAGARAPEWVPAQGAS